MSTFWFFFFFFTWPVFAGVLGMLLCLIAIALGAAIVAIWSTFDWLATKLFFRQEKKKKDRH